MAASRSPDERGPPKVQVKPESEGSIDAFVSGKGTRSAAIMAYGGWTSSSAVLALGISRCGIALSVTNAPGLRGRMAWRQRSASWMILTLPVLSLTA